MTRKPRSTTRGADCFRMLLIFVLCVNAFVSATLGAAFFHQTNARHQRSTMDAGSAMGDDELLVATARGGRAPLAMTPRKRMKATWMKFGTPNKSKGGFPSVDLVANINDDISSNEQRASCINRRSLLLASSSQLCYGTLFGLNTPTWAEEGPLVVSGSFAASPSAVRGPLELLRPATRARLFIDRAVATCQSVQSALDTTDTKLSVANTNEMLQPIREVLLQEPESFMTPDEMILSKRYLKIDTSSGWQEARRKEREARGAEQGIDYTTPYDKFNTAVQQWGDKRQFQILRKRQLQLEQNSAMRAAFNAYTNNLVFGDAYQLNVEGDAKKALVRNDALPNVNAVVVSDLDLRDLYRNQVLQNVDEAKAELSYQLRTGEVDVDEILKYLLDAQSSCQEWFSFVPKEDVEEARKAVLASSQ